MPPSDTQTLALGEVMVLQNLMEGKTQHALNNLFLRHRRQRMVHRWALEGERFRKERDGPYRERIPVSQCLGLHMQACGSQSPEDPGSHQPDSAPIQAGGEPGSFCIDMRKRE